MSRQSCRSKLTRGTRSGRFVTALLTKYPRFDETPGQHPGNKDIYCRSWRPLHPDLHPIINDLYDELLDGAATGYGEWEASMNGTFPTDRMLGHLCTIWGGMKTGKTRKYPPLLVATTRLRTLGSKAGTVTRTE